MRLPDILPMTLVEEQSFVHLWWANSVHGAEADIGVDPEILSSAAEVLKDWSSTARATGRQLAFGSRGCWRATSKEGGDCSWISGISAQQRGNIGVNETALEWTGEPFTYPFGADATADPLAQRGESALCRSGVPSALCLAS